MTYNIILQPVAVADVERIIGYLAERSPQGAAAWRNAGCHCWLAQQCCFVVRTLRLERWHGFQQPGCGKYEALLTS